MTLSATRRAGSLSNLKIIYDQYYENTRFFLLTNPEKTTIYLSYQVEDDFEFNLINLEDFQNVKPAKEYNSERQLYCDFCGEYKQSQLAGSKNKPDLRACHSCHDTIREKFKKLLFEADYPDITAQMI